jgi:hypothetical protein
MPGVLARRLLDLHQLGLLGAEAVPHGMEATAPSSVYSPPIGIVSVYLSRLLLRQEDAPFTALRI